MVSEFRFLVICRSLIDNEGLFTLQDVVDTVYLDKGDLPCDLELTAAVGIVIRPPMWGKPLDLMAWQLGNKMEREPLVKYAGTPLLIPQGRGASTCAYQIKLPIWTTGVYGFDLFDREGVLGDPEKLLATYLFGVDEL